mgnify:CR=1 FL=1
MPIPRDHAAIFNQLPEFQAMRSVFELMPDVYFFVKDTGSRMVAASPMILDRLGFKPGADGFRLLPRTEP